MKKLVSYNIQPEAIIPAHQPAIDERDNYMLGKLNDIDDGA